jgi:hypothetical protein
MFSFPSHKAMFYGLDKQTYIGGNMYINDSLVQDMKACINVNAEELYERIRVFYNDYVINQRILDRITFESSLVQIMFRYFPYMGYWDANRIIAYSIAN